MRTILLLLLISPWTAAFGFPAEDQTIYLWPQQVPGENTEKKEPVVLSDKGDRVTRLSDVTNPMLLVYKPTSCHPNDAAVIICPGGGYRILAFDKEGSEIAEWLARLGYTAFVLQYRVPKKQAGALQDIQRSVGIVRRRASEWNIDPNQIGVIGFSAGASLCARLSTQYAERTYPLIDDSDRVSCRPDFSVLIYPAYLDKGKNRTLTPELSVDKNTPPMFIFGTADDSFGNSTLVMAGALRDAGVPVELHVLPTGGHGYGLRAGNSAAVTWPVLAEQWLAKTTGSPTKPNGAQKSN